MIKKILSSVFVSYVLFSPQIFANEYHVGDSSIIHTVKIIEGWCGNLAISTKAGFIEKGECHYQTETTPYGYDGCMQYLNGKMLEKKIGPGYTCAATHIHSNTDGSEGLDVFNLILDGGGHYIGSMPAMGEVKLVKKFK